MFLVNCFIYELALRIVPTAFVSTSLGKWTSLRGRKLTIEVYLLAPNSVENYFTRF